MEKIKKILLIASLIGIMLLLLISQQIDPKITQISEINESQLNNKVKVEANIIDTRDYSNDTFHVITLKDDSGTIQAIFSSKAQKLDINSSFNYTITGKIEKYNETLQINADKIILSKG